MKDVVVIGAGQAGLAMSYCLLKSGVDHLVLHPDARVGDNWRKRWDSLHLFSPAEYNNLPGYDFPLPKGTFPSKDQAGDYLQAYAEKHELPVRHQTRVLHLEAIPDGFRLRLDDGATMEAKQVVVATGPFTVPWRPAVFSDLPASIRQFHTSTYQNPAGLGNGPVLVVGAGASGSQIAREIGLSGRKTYLSGRDTGSFPRRLLGKDIYWWFYKTGLIRMRWDSWLGRRVLKGRDNGDALVGDKLSEMVREAGLIRKPKLTGVRDGKLEFADGSVLADVETVVWATGYQQQYPWIDLPVFESDGSPRHERGVVADAPGLYFVGLKTLYRANSSLMGGVGEDARYLAQVMADRL